MNELADRLVGLTKQRLAKLSNNPGVDAESDEAIRTLLKTDFPLAALSTPACRECGLCDLLEDRVTEWLADGHEI